MNVLTGPNTSEVHWYKCLLLLDHWPSFWMTSFLTSHCSSRLGRCDFSLVPKTGGVSGFDVLKWSLLNYVTAFSSPHRVKPVKFSEGRIKNVLKKSNLQTSPVLIVIPAVSYGLLIIVCRCKWRWLFGMARGSVVGRHRGFWRLLFRTWGRNQRNLWRNVEHNGPLLSF